MALLTPAEWNKRQAGMPPEDRISYAEYVRQSGGTLEQFRTAEAAAATPTPVSVSAVESAAAARAKAIADAKAKAAQDKAAADVAAKQAAEDAYYTVKVGTTGKTQAQLDALDNAIATAKQISDTYGNIGITSTVDPKTGKVVTTDKTAAKIAADKAAAEAAAKAAADAAAKAAAEAAAKAEADKKAAEAAIAAAKTAKELEDAKAALIKANKDAADAAVKAAADAKAAQEKADAELAAAKAAGDAKAEAAAQAAADAAANTAANAQAQADAKAAQSNLNVSGNVVTPFAGNTAADVAAQAEVNRLAEVERAREEQRQSTIAILTDRFTKYNLGGLAKKIKELAIDGANEATITLSLQETDEYKTRFKANEERVKKGLQVLTPAEYLNVEDGYRQVLRSYGLKQFDTDAYVSQFIANDVSPTEFSNRVVTAVQRVQNSDPAITQQLRDYYGIGTQDLVAYVLDPEQQFQKIERQVAAAEIGAAAKRQGLEAGVSVAEQLAAQGITQAEAQKGYATIADILPTAEKLSSIYGGTMAGYGQSEGEQEVFNQLASAQRKRQALSAREIAQFSGTSGVNKTSLMSETKGTF